MRIASCKCLASAWPSIILSYENAYPCSLCAVLQCVDKFSMKSYFYPSVLLSNDFSHTLKHLVK
jgi:hypothetical protein